MTAEPLQRRTPASFKPHIAARPIAALAEKIFWMRSMVMTLARLLCYTPALESEPVAGNVRFVPGVSDARSPTAGTAAGFSIATIAGLAAGTHRCNNAPSDASTESSSRIQQRSAKLIRSAQVN
jgi:hypothetical protein